MANSDTFDCAAGVTVSINRLGDAVVKLTGGEGQIDSAMPLSQNSTIQQDAIQYGVLHQQDAVQPDTLQKTAIMTVYLAYAEEVQRQHYLTLQVSHGTTLYEALAQAGWLTQFEGLARWCEEVTDIVTPTAKRWHVGVYAQKQPLSYLLQPFDRIEVYRSLNADPMSQRKSKSRG